MSKLLTAPWALDPSYRELFLINASVVDVELGQVHRSSSVHIVDGIFQQVQLGAPIDPPKDSVVVDLQHKFLCPGLIDCHVHLTAAPGATTLRELYSAASTLVAFRTTYVAKQMLLRGFTTARDTGGADAALKQSIAEGLIPGPRLFIAGRALSQTGGHGDFRTPEQGDTHKCCGGGSPSLARICDGVPECLIATRDELRKGADFIKIMCGGGVATPTDPIDMLQFSAEEIQAVTSTAAKRNTYVTAHAYTPESIRHAVENGVKGIEHGNLIDTATAQLCKERGVTVTPTLVVYHGYTKPAFADYLSETSASKNRQVLASGLESLRILKTAGVNMCFGSDLLGGLHILQNEEFRIRSAVLSNLELLQAATINGARYVGMEGKLGVIRDGTIADFLVLDQDPLQDITVLDRVTDTLLAVVKEGRPVMSRVKGLQVDALYQQGEKLLVPEGNAK